MSIAGVSRRSGGRGPRRPRSAPGRCGRCAGASRSRPCPRVGRGTVAVDRTASLPPVRPTAGSGIAPGRGPYSLDVVPLGGGGARSGRLAQPPPPAADRRHVVAVLLDIHLVL